MSDNQLADSSVIAPAASTCATDGLYVGRGTVNLTFQVSACGTVISGLTGDTGATCNVQYNNFQDITFGGGAHTTAVSSDAFDDSYSDDSGGNSTIRFQGLLDGLGGASGSIQVRDPACKADATWSAALQGRTPPPPPQAAPPVPTATAACDPAPCGTSTKVTLYVKQVRAVPVNPAYRYGGVVVVFDITNSDDVRHGVLISESAIKSPTSEDPGGYSSPQQSNGDALVQCTPVVDLPPGQSAQNQMFCFPYTSAAEAGQDLSLLWHVGNEPQQSVIPLGPAQ